MTFLQRTKNLTGRLQNHIESYNEKSFVWMGTIFYAAFAGINIVTHEMWFDEIQHWLIAKDSHSLFELFHNLRYEGHPPLWYFLLYILSRITHNPAAMQLLHLAIATCAAYIFLRFAPFTKVQRLLFIFGYFPVYEYAAISTNYAIGVLLIFCLCVCFQIRNWKRYMLFSVILFLLCQTNAYSFLLSASFVCMLVFEFLINRKVQPYLPSEKMAIFFFICLLLLGFLTSIVVMVPPSDSGLTEGVKWTKEVDLARLQRTLRSIWQAFVPIPRIGRHCYWNTNILPGRTLPSLLALPLICFLLLLFIRKRLIFFMFSFSNAAILLFQYFKHTASLRHNGHLFILFIACLWLSKYYKDDTRLKSPTLLRMADFCSNRKNGFLNIVLIIHFTVGIFASGMEWSRPFSASKTVAQYIKANGLDRLPTLGDSGFWTSPVAGYLDRSIYYPAGDRFGSFVILNQKDLRNIDEAELIEKAQGLKMKEKADVLLILSYELKTNPEQFMRVKEFHVRTIWAIENYYLYLLKYSSP